MVDEPLPDAAPERPPLAPPVALTIAGSDAGGGAGIQADLRTFALHGVHGTSAITALTAQNTLGVQGVFPVPAGFVAAQLESVLGDLDVVAAKTGMLGEPAAIDAVAAALERNRPAWLVVDPVMVATSGDRLLSDDGVVALRGRLLPLADLLTPNRAEAAVLLGRDVAADTPAREAAAVALSRAVGTAVLLTGGAEDGADCLSEPVGGVRWFTGERVATRHTHGTGCHLSAAIVARLARGDGLVAAIDGAKRWLTDALRHGQPLGAGASSPWPRTDRDD